jgi:[CysO sulfur-carrier protein]-S-L-cysteine hydrolase
MNSKYILPDKNLTLTITEELLDKMYLSVKAHYPNEFGGLLIGFYNDDNKNLVITDILLPNVFTSTPVFFERQAEDLQKDLQDFYSSAPAKFYVGEWHSHPNGGTMPSSRDIKAMMYIQDDGNVAVEKPILGILSYNNKTENYKIQFHLIINNKIYTYEKN